MEITDPLDAPANPPIEPSGPMIEKEPIHLKEKEVIAEVLQPAGFIRRAIAFIIDFFIVEFLYLFLMGMGVWGMQISRGGTDIFFSSDSAGASLAIPFIAVWFFLFIGYFTFFHAYDGQTPAKMIIRIKVVTEEGALLSFPRALVRSFGYFLSGFFFGFGFLVSIFEKKKRALHDLLVRSSVVLS
jgi:uncharacterized RDD family membrane protein YckC